MNAKRVSPALEDPSVHDEPSEIRRRFARNLRQAREAAGLTQYGLAKASSFARGLIAKLETDATNVKLDTITRLAKALGLTEVDLLGPSMEHIIAKRIRRGPGEPLSKTEPTEFRRRFARNLRAKRRARGVFQKALSRAAGMQPSVEGDIEVNATNVTLDTVTRLAKALGVTEIDLLGPEDG